MPGVTGGSPKAIESQERVRKMRAALEARLRKEPYREIAERLGVSIDTVRVWVKEMTQTMLPQEDIEELRAQDVNSLDEMERRTETMIEMATYEGAKRREEGASTVGIIEQIQRLQAHKLDIQKRRAALLGMDTPVKVQHAVTVRTEFDAEVESLVSDLLGGGKVLTDPEMVDVGEDV
jgi:transposase